MNADDSGDAVPVDIAAWAEAGSRLLNRGLAKGDRDSIRRAVETFETVLAATTPGDTNRLGATVNTANALVAEFELTGRQEALTRAITLLEEVEPEAPQLGFRQADFYSILGQALLRDAERSGLSVTAERAVTAKRQALQLTRRDEATYCGRLSDLGGVLAVQYRITGDLEALREAIRVDEAGTGDAPAGDIGLAGRLSNLGTCLDELALRTSDAAMLQRAVQVQRDAIEVASPDDALLPMIRSNLGITLEHLYEETGSRSALAEAITAHRRAVEQTPEEHVEYWPRQTNLAVSLLSLYERTGDMGALDEAIVILRRAVERTPEGHASRIRYTHDLASALMRLAEHTGDFSGVDEALGLWKDVVEATPNGHPSKPGRLSALATAMLLRFRRDPSDLEALDSAIQALREALALTPKTHVLKAMLLSNLGGLLDSRFEHTGDEVALEEALRRQQEAVALTSTDHSERSPYQSNLGISLLRKARTSEDDDDVNHAISVLSEALQAVGADDPRRALTLYALGAAYARAHELGHPDALHLGLQALRDAAGMDIAPIAVRIRAGRDQGILAASGELPDEALDGFSTAVRLMEEATWGGLDRVDQQHLLTELNGLPMDAAAMAIETGRPEEAVELLEQGRGVLLARQLEAPSLQAQLLSRAPELAGQLAWVQSALEGRTPDEPGVRGEHSPPLKVQGTADRRNRLVRQRAQILQRVRSQAGLEDLAALPTLNRLMASAAQGPVIIVNISQYRCDALILAGDQLRLVPLTSLTSQQVAEQVRLVLDRTEAAVQTAVEDTLQWLWETIVAPVFADLGLTEPTAPGDEPHVWWCATGLAAFLPLHAAGDQRKDDGAQADAIELAISSYTPTVRTLLQLRDRQPADPASDSRLLIVAMPETPGQNNLTGADQEADYLADRCPDHTLLRGPSATREAVVQALPQHRWVHFSCHGSQNLKQPDRAALHLYDGPLAIPQIVELELPGPALAYLSACDTSKGGTDIPDEAITLASALQIAGYQHVIATLWQISGLTADDVARRFYDQIIAEHDGVTSIQAGQAAVALRTAVQAIRAQSVGLPAMYWASYIHTGP